MTETTARAPSSSSPRLERPSHTSLRGVATALARTTGTDVVLWRVLFVVLAFFNGLGIVLYLVGMVTIPREGQPQSLAQRLVHGPNRHLRRGELIVLVLLGLASAGFVDRWDGLFTAVVVAAVVLLYLRTRDDKPSSGYGVAGAPVTPGAAPQPETLDLSDSPPFPPYPPSSWTPPPPRPRSPLGGVTASLAFLVAGVLILLGATGADGITAEVVLASALAVVGVGLVVGAWWGRSTGLILLALLLGLGLAGTATARPAIDAGVGDRTWRPTADGSYRLGVGEATLDLRTLPIRESGTTALTARVDVGHLLVIVPDGVRVVLDARAQLGDLLIVGGDTNGRDVHRHAELGGEGAPQVHLDLSVRTGQVEVRRG